MPKLVALMAALGLAVACSPTFGTSQPAQPATVVVPR